MAIYLQLLARIVLWIYIALGLIIALPYSQGLLGSPQMVQRFVAHAILLVTAVSSGAYLAVVLRGKPQLRAIAAARRPFRLSLYGASILFLFLYFVSVLGGLPISLPAMDLVLIALAWIVLSYHYLFCAITDPIIIAKRVSYTCWFAMLFLSALFAIATAHRPDAQIADQFLHRLALLCVMTTLCLLALYPLRKLHRHDLELRNDIATIEKQMNIFRPIGISFGLLAAVVYLVTIVRLGQGVSWVYKAFKGWAVLPFMVSLTICGVLSLPKPAVKVKTLRRIFWSLTAYLFFLVVLFFFPRGWVPGLLAWLLGHAYLKTVVHWFVILGSLLLLLLRFIRRDRSRQVE